MARTACGMGIDEDSGSFFASLMSLAESGGLGGLGGDGGEKEPRERSG